MLTNIGQSPDLPWLVTGNLFCTIGCLDNCERNKEKQPVYPLSNLVSCLLIHRSRTLVHLR